LKTQTIHLLKRLSSGIRFSWRRLFFNQEGASQERKWELIEGYRKKLNVRTLVESGTLFGDTVFRFKDRFEKIISIELSEELADKAIKRFEKDSNITILKGDSADVLPKILSSLREPVLFWLDGHYSYEFVRNGEMIRTAKGETETPVGKELDAIIAAKISCVILIDDARIFTGEGDYPSIRSIRRKIASCKQYNKFKVSDDIIQIISKF
jgi:hypothetical protein